LSINAKIDEMIQETPFKGSPLQTEIGNSQGDKLHTLRILITVAVNNKPESLFWNEAFEMINKKK
jgi:hypothetical protein